MTTKTTGICGQRQADGTICTNAAGCQIPHPAANTQRDRSDSRTQDFNGGYSETGLSPVEKFQDWGEQCQRLAEDMGNMEISIVYDQDRRGGEDIPRRVVAGGRLNSWCCPTQPRGSVPVDVGEPWSGHPNWQCSGCGSMEVPDIWATASYDDIISGRALSAEKFLRRAAVNRFSQWREKLESVKEEAAQLVKAAEKYADTGEGELTIYPNGPEFDDHVKPWTAVLVEEFGLAENKLLSRGEAGWNQEPVEVVAEAFVESERGTGQIERVYVDVAILPWTEHMREWGVNEGWISRDMRDD